MAPLRAHLVHCSLFKISRNCNIITVHIMVRLSVCVVLLLAVGSVLGARLPDNGHAIGHSQKYDGKKKHNLPLVMWHGMGDSCCTVGGLGSIKRAVEDELGELRAVPITPLIA